MNSVLEKVRQKYPEYSAIPDGELTRRIGEKHPEYLEVPDFKADFDALTPQGKTLPEVLSEPPITMEISVVPGLKEIPADTSAGLPKAKQDEQYKQLSTMYQATKELLPSDDIEKHQQLEAAYQSSLKQIGIEPLKLEKFREGGFIPQVSKEDLESLGASKITAEVGAGAQQAVASAVDGMLANPEFFFLPAMPKVLQRAYAGAFAVQMAKEAPRLLIDFADAVEKKDYERAARDLTGAGVSGAFAFALGKEATGIAAKQRIEAEAGKQMLQQVEAAPLTNPDLVARNLAAPGTVRATEQAVFGTPTIEPPAATAVLAPQTAKALEEVSLVSKASPELMETAKLVAQRASERGAPGKLPEGEAAVRPTPGFLQTAEQRIVATAREAPEVKESDVPNITQARAVKVYFLNGRMTIDPPAPVLEAAKVKALTEQRAREMQAGKLPSAEPQPEVTPIDAVQTPEGIILNPSAELLATVQRLQERGQGGRLPASGQEFISASQRAGFTKGFEERAAARGEVTQTRALPERELSGREIKDAETIVRERLEKRDWQAAVSELAKLPAEASAKMVEDLTGASKKSVPLSAAERTIFNEIWNREVSKSTPAAVESSPYALGITPRLSAPAKAAGELIARALHFYSTPLAERLASEGGSQAKGFANMAKEISQRSKELYGSITPSLDPALEATGKLNKTTTWLNDIAPTTDPWGYRNAVAAVEGPIKNVPAAHRAIVDTVKNANLEIGRLAQSGVQGFVATGKYQRQPTAFLVDTIRSGRGPAHDLLVRALAAENRMPAARVRSSLKDIKAEFDAPGSQQTVHRIAQEFERVFPKFPTDLKIGGVWTPILHAKPFEYLQNAALSTSQRVAFLERVPQSTIGQLREGIVSELKSQEAFDELVRALHGLPVDQPSKLFTPGSAGGMMASGVNRILGDVFSPLKLTASALYNIPETFLGNTPAFFGWKNFLRGAVELSGRHDALEQMGAINRNIYNWSYDPKAPIRSVMNDFRNGVRKATLQQFFNEMQEMLAASTAQVFAERAQAGRLSTREKSLFADTARAIGFERPAAESMSAGRGTPDQYGNFTRRAASFATGGNMQAAEGSRFAGSRLLGGLFRFQSYPMMKLNAHNKAWRNMIEAVESRDGSRIASSSEQLAKFLFGTAAQGAATAYLAALLRGGKAGVEIKNEETKDEPGEFILDSLLSGIGGPISAINYAVGSGQAADMANPENLNLSKTFPGSVYMELMELLRGKGAFKDLSAPDALGKYVAEKIPAGRIGRTALAAVGLSKHNTDLDESIRAFYRWRREELGYTSEKSELSEDSRAEFRQRMKKAVELIKRGEDFVPEIVKAAGTEGASRKALGSSMRARTILKSPEGKKLTPEQSEALKKRIGEKAYDRIFWHDAMVEAIADRLD